MLQVVGVGLGRTGTNSLKLALEELLGGRCYHMFELMQRPQDLPAWERAVQGEEVDWGSLFGGYAASVDWPGCAFWRELRAANPDAMVLLSTRDSPQTWWASMERTIVPVLSGPPIGDDPNSKRGQDMIREMFRTRFTPEWADREGASAAYERHCEEVRSEVPSEKLIEWQAGEGWEPICEGLGIALPGTDFPHENSSGDFMANVMKGIVAMEGAPSGGAV
jgi:hypothetical protein